MQSDHHAASILAIGDSWFWYPFPGGSLLNQLGPLVAPGQHYLLAIGNNGAEAYDYVEGKYRKQVRTALQFHGPALSAVFVSGGGNDFAGFNDLRPLLKNDCSAAAQAKDCFRPGGGDGTLGWLMRKTGEHYTSLVGQIRMACRPETAIFLHTYDYSRPDGKGVLGGSGWLKPALEDAKVPQALHFDCIRHLVDRFAKTLEAVQKKDPARIVLVDSRGTLAEADWANELHPKPKGFRKIARGRWKPLLEAHGLAG